MHHSQLGAKRHRQAAWVIWLSVAVNIVLMVAKGGIGLWAGSRALFADAVHSAADLAGSFAVMVGLRVARKPPDADHPYGHGKAELLSSALVAVLLIAASLDVGYRSIAALWHAPAKPQWIAAWTALASIVVKELLYRYSYLQGKRLSSPSLLATAVDHRSDVYASLAALVGILLSLAGHRFSVPWLLYADAVAGATVAGLVVKMGYDIAANSVHVLMDRVVAEADLAPYQELILSVPGVVAVDEMRARDHGQYIVVDVKIRVPAQITVAEGHSIAAEVRSRLRDMFPRVLDVFVHVNPHYGHDPTRKDDRRD